MDFSTIGGIVGLLSFPTTILTIWDKWESRKRAQAQEERAERQLVLAQDQSDREELRLSAELLDKLVRIANEKDERDEQIADLMAHKRRCDAELDRAARDRQQLLTCQRERTKLARQLAAARGQV